MPYADPEKQKAGARKRAKTYRLKHGEKVRTQNRIYLRAARKANPARFKAYNKKWYSSHPGYYKNKYHADLEHRLMRISQSRIRDALKNGWKSARTRELLGCSIPELKVHLERQFRPGMTWENYGPVWHVDHIKACAKFDLTDPAQQRECFHFSNLQPLFAIENFQKGGR